MPAYDVHAVAEALDITPKQLDNLLSRNRLHGVDRKRRGVTRRLTVGAAVTIKLGWELAKALRIPMPTALDLASGLEQSGESRLAAGEFVEIRVDVARLKADVSARLDVAVEAVGRRPRGRPPRRARERAWSHETVSGEMW